MGLTADQVDWSIRTGRFRLLRRRVLAVAGSPPTWEQTVMGAVLAGGADDLVGYATGARLWAFDPRPPSEGIDVISPAPRRGRTPGVIGHRTRLLVPADVARRSGIPVTSAARTLIDCGGLLGIEGTGRALDGLMRRRLVTLDQVRATASRLAGPGRRTLRPIAHALATRVEGYELSDSDLEVTALQLIRRAGLPLPVQQHRVRAGGQRYVLDLAYPERMVAVELDGWEWHGRRRSGFDRSHRRLAALTRRAGRCSRSPPRRSTTT